MEKQDAPAHESPNEPRARSSAEERLLHTQDVGGSIPSAPTILETQEELEERRAAEFVERGRGWLIRVWTKPATNSNDTMKHQRLRMLRKNKAAEDTTKPLAETAMTTELWAIIEKLAELRPTAPRETDGDPDCFFCGAWDPQGVEDHDADCLWRAAVELSTARNKKSPPAEAEGPSPS